MKEGNFTDNHRENNNSQRASTVQSIYDLNDSRKVVDAQLN